MVTSVQSEVRDIGGTACQRRGECGDIQGLLFVDSSSILLYGVHGRRAVISSTHARGAEIAQKSSHILLEHSNVTLWKWEHSKKHSAVILSDLNTYIYTHDNAMTSGWDLTYKVNLKAHLLPNQGGSIVDVWMDLTIHRLFFIFVDGDTVAVKQSIVSFNDQEHSMNITPGLTLYSLQTLVGHVYSDHVLFTIDKGESGYVLTANTHAIGRVFRSSFRDLGLPDDFDQTSVGFVDQVQCSPVEGGKRSIFASSYAHIRTGDKVHRIQCDMNGRLAGLKAVGSVKMRAADPGTRVLASNERSVYVLSARSEYLSLLRWDLATKSTSAVPISVDMSSRGVLRAVNQTAVHFEVDDRASTMRVAVGHMEGRVVYLRVSSLELGDLSTWSLAQWLEAAVPAPLECMDPDPIALPVPPAATAAPAALAVASPPPVGVEPPLAETPLDASSWVFAPPTGAEGLVWTMLRDAVNSRAPVPFADTPVDFGSDDEFENEGCMTEEERQWAMEELMQSDPRDDDVDWELVEMSDLPTCVFTSDPERDVQYPTDQPLWVDQLDIVTLQPMHSPQAHGRDDGYYDWQRVVGKVDALVLADVIQYVSCVAKGTTPERVVVEPVPMFLNDILTRHRHCSHECFCALIDLYATARGVDYRSWRQECAGIVADACEPRDAALRATTYAAALSKSNSASNPAPTGFERDLGYRHLVDRMAAVALGRARQLIQEAESKTRAMDWVEAQEVCKILLTTGRLCSAACLLAGLGRLAWLACLSLRISASANHLHIHPLVSYVHKDSLACEYAYYDPVSSDYYKGRGAAMLEWDMMHRHILPSDARSRALVNAAPAADSTDAAASGCVPQYRRRMEQAVQIFELTLRMLSKQRGSPQEDEGATRWIEELVRCRPLQMPPTRALESLRRSAFASHAYFMRAMEELLQ